MKKQSLFLALSLAFVNYYHSGKDKVFFARSHCEQLLSLLITEAACFSYVVEPV